MRRDAQLQGFTQPMRLARRHTVIDLDGITGAVRLDRATAKLTPRLRPGDIAVLDHLDLDAASAQALVACGVAAVVNASPSTSGRYPNLGPAVLVEAGIPLLDAVGAGVFEQVSEGKMARLTHNELWVGDRQVATGRLQDTATVAAAAEHARAGLAAQVADLVANTTGFLLDERDLLLEGLGIPPLRTDLADRAVLVVARGDGDVEQLASLRRWIRKGPRRKRPVLIGVEAGADLLLEAGLRPDIVVGNLDEVSERALTSAREVVVRAGAAAHSSAVEVRAFATNAASEDMALLLAQHARLIVTVGFPTTVLGLLDRGRAGASSALLTRMSLGDRVIGAGVVAGLTRRRPRLAVPLLWFGAVVAACVGFAGFDGAVLSARWEALAAYVPW